MFELQVDLAIQHGYWGMLSGSFTTLPAEGGIRPDVYVLSCTF